MYCLHLSRKFKIIEKYKILIRLESTLSNNNEVIKYTDTINLPKTKFPLRLNQTKRKEIEKALVENTFASLYHFQYENNTGNTFVLHDGPPYANGDLHMGHAVNKILKDITIKKHLVNNEKVHYKPGWDCHGLPIELKAISVEGNLDPLNIREKSRQFATEAIRKQSEEFQHWGITADWKNSKNLYKTFDLDYITNQLKIFLDLYMKNLIYRDLKPVYWSPSSKSALAEAELEYDQNFVSPSILLQLKLIEKPPPINKYENVYGIIWTTTPWTLPANQAVCYNIDLPYSIVKISTRENAVYILATDLIKDFKEMTSYQVEILSTFPASKLAGITYQHPINRNEVLPFLPAEHVQGYKGTGLVHTAPAHGPDDFLVSLNNSIRVKCLIDEKGKYTEDAPKFLIKKSALDEGNKLVTDYLRDDILHCGQITHSYPIDWRTKKPVILRASEQWFINTDKLQADAIRAIDAVHMYPHVHSETSKRLLKIQLEKRPYWCISRQRAWGVPIPVFYNKSNSNKMIINDKITERICSLVNKHKTIDFWWSEDAKYILGDDIISELGIKNDEIVKGQDILDIWFDSGTSWSYALEGDKIADIYIEGLDQFTGWFQSSLLMSIACRNRAPYKSIFVHGFAVDEKGYKMSKSLGNVILPKEIVNKYGIDVMRWWVASHATQNTSIIVSHNLLQASAESLSRIRSILKYLVGISSNNGQLEENDSHIVDLNLTILDRFILNALYKFEQKVKHLYENYEYNRITAVCQNFIANQLSSTYMHLVKDRLYCGNNKDFNTVQTVIKNCLHILCKALWPITPFLIEECWSYYGKKPFYQENVSTSNTWIHQDSAKVLSKVNTLRHILSQVDEGINTWKLNIEIECNPEFENILLLIHPKVHEKLNSTELCELLQVASVTLIPNNNLLETNEEARIRLKSVENKLCPRCRRFAIQDSLLCNRCDEVLQLKNNIKQRLQS